MELAQLIYNRWRSIGLETVVKFMHWALELGITVKVGPHVQYSLYYPTGGLMQVVIELSKGGRHTRHTMLDLGDLANYLANGGAEYMARDLLVPPFKMNGEENG